MVVAVDGQDGGWSSEAITASRAGNERWVPRAVTERAAAATASRAASSGCQVGGEPDAERPDERVAGAGGVDDVDDRSRDAASR